MSPLEIKSVRKSSSVNATNRIKRQVVKRDGTLEPVSFDKITMRLVDLCDMEPTLDPSIDPQDITRYIIDSITDRITTIEIDNYTAKYCGSKLDHPDYLKLAGRLVVSSHQKNLTKQHKLGLNFSYAMSQLFHNMNQINKSRPLITTDFYNFVEKNAKVLDSWLVHERDYLIDYFGINTLLNSYLKKKYDPESKQQYLIESPQHMYMRIAVSMHMHEKDTEFALSKIKESYDLLSMHYFTHATPTLFNAGTQHSQLSCFLLPFGPLDSIESNYKSISDAAKISQGSGGIGGSITDVRSNGAYIGGSGGTSSGIVPYMQVINATAKYVNQGGKRNGSIALYLEPWHADIFDFIDAKTIHGPIERKARELFYALWVPDLFMNAVMSNGPWYLMCPSVAVGLSDVYGAEFEALYNKYVEDPSIQKQKINAVDLWKKIIDCQIETGMPYMSYKDSVNRKNNQMNIGVVKSSNLCVAPETRILTNKGYFPIYTLKDQEVEIWNGFEWSNVTVKQTNTNQKLLKVTCSNGTVLHCTEYHKFAIDSDEFEDDVDTIEAKDLKEGMRLIRHELPEPNIEEDGPELKYPYTHGLFCSEGTYCFTPYGPVENRKQPRITLYGDKKQLISELEKEESIRTCSYEETANKTINVMIKFDLAEKYMVPLNYSFDSKLKWFAGMCDGDGTVCRTGKNESIQVTSVYKDYLMSIQLMLQTIGIKSIVTKNKDARKEYLPDGQGSMKEYDCLPTFRLLVSGTETQKLLQLGVVFKRLKISKREFKPAKSRPIIVSSVEDLGRFDDTYCFTEPLRGMGTFEGIVTLNCNEIVEVSSPTKYACCCLASIVLSKYVIPFDNTIVDNQYSTHNTGQKKSNEKKKHHEDKVVEEKKQTIYVRGSFDHKKLAEVVKVIVRNLDNLIDINQYPVPEAKASNMSERPLGIGVQGLSDVFYAMGLPYDSQEARDLNRTIFETIYYAAISASIELAKERGPYPSYEGSPASKGLLQFDLWNAEKDQDYKPVTDANHNWTQLKKDLKQYGLRNSMLTACMPTASTAQICGSTEAFEPATENMYVRKVLAGEFTYINKYLMADLAKLPNFPSLVKKVKDRKGSIQNIRDVPKWMKDLYKTAFELPQKDLVDKSADRGPFIDQSQSLNLFFKHEKDNKNGPLSTRITRAHMYGFKRGLKTGSYYIRTENKDVHSENVTLEFEEEEYHEQHNEHQDLSKTMSSTNVSTMPIINRQPEPEISSSTTSTKQEIPEACDMCSS